MSFSIPYASGNEGQKASRISDLLLRSAAIQAEGQRRGGEIWGGTLASLGKTVADTLTEMHRQKQNAPLIAAETKQRLGQAALTQQQVDQGNRQTKLSDVMANQSTMAAQGQELTPEQIAQNLDANGLGEFKSKVLADYEGSKAIMQKQRDTTAHAIAFHADKLLSVADGPLFPMYLASAESELKDIAPGAQQVFEQIKALPPDQRKEALTHYAGISQLYNKEKADTAKSNRVVVPESSSVIEIGPDGKSTTVVKGTPKPIPAPNLQHVETAEGIRAFNPVTGEIGPVIAKSKPTAGVDPAQSNDDVNRLLNGGVASGIPIKQRSAAIAGAKASGGVDGTGFVPESEKQQNKFNDLMDLRNKAIRLNQMLEIPEVAKKLGPLMGRAVDWTKEWPLIGQDTTVKEAFDLFKDLSDTELRKRSGAAISPGEYSRITGFTVDPSKQPDSNKTNLKRMMDILTRDLHTLGADRLGVVAGPKSESGKAGAKVDASGLDKPQAARKPVQNPDGSWSMR